MNNFNIEQFLDLSTYATDTRVARRKSNDELEISNTNEFFTPYSIVKIMGDKVSEENGMIQMQNFQKALLETDNS